MDIFEYELKYKHDEHIMNLVRAYKELEDEAGAANELCSDAEDKAEDFESHVTSLESEAERVRRDIVKVIRILEAARHGKKAEMVDDINEAIQELEGMTND